MFAGYRSKISFSHEKMDKNNPCYYEITELEPENQPNKIPRPVPPSQTPCKVPKKKKESQLEPTAKERPKTTKEFPACYIKSNPNQKVVPKSK